MISLLLFLFVPRTIGSCTNEPLRLKNIDLFCYKTSWPTNKIYPAIVHTKLATLLSRIYKRFVEASDFIGDIQQTQSMSQILKFHNYYNNSHDC